MNKYLVIINMATGDDCKSIAFHGVEASDGEQAAKWGRTALRQLGLKGHTLSVLRED